MSVVATLDELQRPGWKDSDWFATMADRLDSAALRIRMEWDDLRDTEREALAVVVYESFAPRLNAESSFFMLLGAIAWGWTRLRRGDAGLRAYYVALDRFQETVLEQVERSDPKLREHIAAALNEATETTEPVEDIGAWLRGLK